jgi:hypothetical protein
MAASFLGHVAIGQTTVMVPADARQPLRFELEATDAQGAMITDPSDVVDIVCHPSITSSVGLGTCSYPAQTVQASYQPFETGYLIWRGDTQEVFIVGNNPIYHIGWQVRPAARQPVSIQPVPPGLFAPAERFTTLWSSQRLPVSVVDVVTPEGGTVLVSDILGWATAPEQTYEMRIQLEPEIYPEQGDHLCFMLPDERVMCLIVLDDIPSGGPAWYIFDS